MDHPLNSCEAPICSSFIQTLIAGNMIGLIEHTYPLHLNILEELERHALPFGLPRFRSSETFGPYSLQDHRNKLGPVPRLFTQ